MNIDLKKEYRIGTLDGSLALEAEATAANGGCVVLGKWDDSNPYQVWRLEPAETRFRLLCAATGMVLDIALGGTVDGARVHQWENLAVETQLWSLQELADGAVKLFSSRDGKCLDVVGIEVAEGVPLQIWTDVNGDNQQWKLTPADAKRTKPAVKAASKAEEPATKTPAKKRATRTATAKAVKTEDAKPTTKSTATTAPQAAEATKPAATAAATKSKTAAKSTAAKGSSSDTPAKPTRTRKSSTK